MAACQASLLHERLCTCSATLRFGPYGRAASRGPLLHKRNLAGPGAGRCQRPLRGAVRVQASLPGGAQQLSSLVDLVSEAVQSAPSRLDLLAAHTTSLLYTIADAAAVSPSDAADVAAETVKKGSNSGGFFGPLTSAFESVLKVLDAGLDKVGVPYSYGFAIILLTILVKAATFPLTQKQVQSTVAMQTLQPRVKAVQAKYKGKPQEQMQIEVAQLYKEAGVNPLAGCLPTLATIPVFIGLYRALSNVADEGLLSAGFFWIPSLAGPTTLAAQKTGAGFSWLFPLKDGAPPIGWHDAIAYLVLPVLLIVSQYISQKIISPPASNDPQQQQTQRILQFLPLLIGYFSLNVPSGLTLYWFTNNILSTSQQYYLKRVTATPAVAQQASGSSTAGRPQPQVIDVEARKPSGKELGARRSNKSDLEGDAKRQGDKFRALKAKEAAKKAARIAAQAAATATGNAPEPADEGAERALESEASPIKTGSKVQVPDNPPPQDNSSNGSRH